MEQSRRKLASKSSNEGGKARFQASRRFPLVERRAIGCPRWRKC
ncbi:hypothetical protein MtrunA17_Chr2g0302821 [Medicago truncatula]|uniref:Uncharacterized protein n=1 Tax=Medicago truncatula TaxID=3880 RepID=A0A396J6Z0_MEDTR|nr:hypothetical protein MtrunA17_Chr2g0302821 [Medicago truncatula]